MNVMEKIKFLQTKTNAQAPSSKEGQRVAKIAPVFTFGLIYPH